MGGREGGGEGEGRRKKILEKELDVVQFYFLGKEGVGKCFHTELMDGGMVLKPST